jgi:hypothetical protein
MTRIRNRKPRQMTGALSRSRTISTESSYTPYSFATQRHKLHIVVGAKQVNDAKFQTETLPPHGFLLQKG